MTLMESLKQILPWIQIVLSVLLVVVVLLQQSSAGIGGALGGGSDSSSTFHTRRGFERFLFIATFVLSFLFVVSAFLAVFVA